MLTWAMGLAVSLLVLLGGVAGIGYLMHIEERSYAVPLLVVPMAGAVASFLTLIGMIARLPWRRGRIVPARVVMPTMGGDVSPLSLVASAIPGGGLMASAFDSDGPVIPLLLEWIDGGVVRTGTPAVPGTNAIHRANITVWIVLNGKPRLLEGIAPETYRNVAVPAEIDRELRQALSTLPRAPEA